MTYYCHYHCPYNFQAPPKAAPVFRQEENRKVRRNNLLVHIKSCNAVLASGSNRLREVNLFYSNPEFDTLCYCVMLLK